MKLVVGAREFEAVDGGAGGAEAVCVGEPDTQRVVGCGDGDRERAGVFEALAVDEVAGAGRLFTLSA